MSSIFLWILNLSINSSWLIVAVLITRQLLKKAPKWIICLLWGLVAIRLVCPFSFESTLSLLPSNKVIPENIMVTQQPQIDSGITIIDKTVNPIIENRFSPVETSSANPMQILVSVASDIWLVGMVAMLIYALISFIMLKRRVRASVRLNGRIWECDDVESPFILGTLRPAIYVPSGLDDRTLELVVAHEKAHLKRYDHWWKPIGFILLTMYWFNPLSWVAYTLLCRDIEAACDERVIRNKKKDYRAAYSQALLDCSLQRRFISVCPLAFGETGVKGRVKGVLNYKKPSFWIIVAAVITSMVIVVCFMTNPTNRLNVEGSEPQEASDVSDVQPVVADATSLEVKSPVVNLADDEGADYTEILYADSDKIIFSGYYGLFVYSKENRAIVNAVDLEPIGCNYTQGDSACEKYVSADGNVVYLHPMDNTDMYIYNIRTNSLSKENFNLDGIDLHTVYEDESYSTGDCDKWSANGHDYLTMLHHGGVMIGEVSYADVSLDVDPENIQWYPLFSPEGLSGAADFSPEEIHDIVAIDIWISGNMSYTPVGLEISEGQVRRLHCEDLEVIKEIEDLLSNSTKEKGQSNCPFYTALYMTRSDGTIGTVFPATDDCDMYNSGTGCYSMSAESNEKLWTLINQFQEIR